MKLTRKKAIELFRKHWTWLAKTGSMDKEKWIKKHFPKELVDNDCFLCEYVEMTRSTGSPRPPCDSCPIEWPGANCERTSHYTNGIYKNIAGLYSKWVETFVYDSPKMKKQRKIIALKISKLPEKEL